MDADRFDRPQPENPNPPFPCLSSPRYYGPLEVVVRPHFLPLLIIPDPGPPFERSRTRRGRRGDFSPAIRGYLTRRAHVAHRARPRHRRVPGISAGRRGAAHTRWAALDPRAYRRARRQGGTAGALTRQAHRP